MHGQSDQKFDLECSIKISFRHSSGRKILAGFHRIDGLEVLSISQALSDMKAQSKVVN